MNGSGLMIDKAGGLLVAGAESIWSDAMQVLSACSQYKVTAGQCSCRFHD